MKSFGIAHRIHQTIKPSIKMSKQILLLALGLSFLSNNRVDGFPLIFTATSRDYEKENCIWYNLPSLKYCYEKYPPNQNISETSPLNIETVERIGTALIVSAFIIGIIMI